MAGPKETPRQQMINLMYLVLTALLALQVSSSIIDKFLFIKRSLDKSAKETQEASDKAFKYFQKDTVGVNPKEHAAKVDAIKHIQELTKKRIELITSMEDLIITEAAKGKTENGEPKEPGGGETKIEELFVYKSEATAGDKKGLILKRDINAFSNDLSAEVKKFRKDIKTEDEFPPLCLDNKDRKDFVVKKGMEFEINKNFSEAAFQATPVAAALAVLSHLKTEVRRYEAKAISMIAQKEIPPAPDRYTAQVALESKIIAAGQKLKGKVFLVASSSKANMKPKFELSIPVIEEGGIGIIDFAPGGATGKITGKIIADVGKGPEEFPIDPIDYEVRKPSVRLVSGTTRYAVYKGCKHSFTAMSELNPFNPNISVTNVNRLRGNSPTEVVFVPTGKPGEKVNITITAPGLAQPYKDEMDILPVPPPDFFVVQGNKRTNINDKPVVGPGQQFKVELVPNEQFLRAMGATEANYSPAQIRSVRLLKADGTPISGSIGELASKSRPGMTFEVDVVTTRNGSGGPEPITKSFYVPVR